MSLQEINSKIATLTRLLDVSGPGTARAILDRLEGLHTIRQQLDTRGWYAPDSSHLSPLVNDHDR